jgi:1A family penicillin-binding protein
MKRKRVRYQRLPKVLHRPVRFLLAKWDAFQALSRRKKIAIVGGIAAFLLIIVPLISYVMLLRDISDPERLMNRNNTGIVITDRSDEVIYRFGRSSDNRNLSLDEMPEYLVQALVASEDRNFYEHGGFSIRRIAGSLYANILNRDITKYGGSTITQQLVKNNLLTSEKSFFRKYQELAISIAIEQHHSKDQILEMYLNSVYFGEGAFGIAVASDVYFEKPAQDLTLAESALLIGILPAPSAYSPISGDSERSVEQQKRVLGAMVLMDFISEEEKDAALDKPLRISERSGEEQSYAQHFSQIVLAELNQRYGEERIARSGFRVRTSLDTAWQKYAERQISETIGRLSSQGATNASLVAIDPTDGEVRALVGSVDWDNEEFGQVNMAVTPRQPGSSFKPIVFAEALEQRQITPATIIRDEPKQYGDYRPENYDFRFRGDITARYALGNSLNIPAIEVIRELGVEEAVEAAQRMGIDTVNDPESYGLTLALGTAETRLLDMTNAYAAFAHGGKQYNPVFITEINDKYSKQIYQKTVNLNQVQSPEASYLVTSILADERARAATFGSRLNVPGHQVAVKTGTTNDNKDAWTIGYTSDIAVGVWVGDNKNEPMSIGGAAGAGPIWKSSIQRILQDGPISHQFSRPGGVIETFVCTVNGSYTEFFIPGTQEFECNRPEPALEPSRSQQEEEERRRRAAEEEERRRREQQPNTPPPLEPEEPPVIEEPIDDPEEPIDDPLE